MDVTAVKNKNIKKLRPLTSFLIITLSIILLIYITISNEPMAILVVFIIIIKIIDLTLKYRIRRKKTSISII
jgi:hypothetical protein